MHLYSKYSDTDLIALLKSGDKNAFTEIYDRYWSVLYLHARHMLRNQDDASDVIQEVFTSIWNRAKELDLSVNLNAYLYRSVRNAVLNMIRKGKVEGDYRKSLVAFYARGEFSTENVVNFNDLKGLIEREVQSLPKKMREVFELSRNQNASHAEIAKQLNMSDEAVKKQISRALSILRKKLGLPLSIILFYVNSR